MTTLARPAKEGPLSVEEAWLWTTTHFPFEGYIVPRRRSAYEMLAKEALRVLPAGGRILDFGAGPADKTALFALRGLDVVAYDDFRDPWHMVDNNIEKIVTFAAAAGIDYRIGPEPFKLLEGEMFDLIMLHHVLEHLHDSPRGLLVKLLTLLRPGGYLYVTVPNAVNLRKRLSVLMGRTNYPSYASFYWYPGEFRGHVREYVKKDLELLASYLDLRNAHLKSYFHFPHAAPAPIVGLLDLVANIAPGWRDSWMLLAEKPEEWSPATRLSGVELAAALGRGEYYDYSAFTGDDVTDR